MIEIGLCCDEGYAMPCGVCITSIFESNRAHRIRVHILTDGLSEDTTRRFEETAKRYGQQIEIYNIDDSTINNIETRRAITKMAYARLLIPRILDNSIDRLLYLDCDTVVVGDLSELWNLEFGSYSCLAVKDGLTYSREWMQKKTAENNHPYVNSGVVLMNLPLWRDENWGERCIEYASKYPEKFHYNDQDAINDIICHNIGFMHLKYNFFSQLFLVYPSKVYHNKEIFTHFEQARKSPVVIHYAALKPWYREYFRSSKRYFIDALNCSLWRDYKIKSKSEKLKGWRIIPYHIKGMTSDIFKYLRDVMLKYLIFVR